MTWLSKLKYKRNIFTDIGPEFASKFIAALFMPVRSEQKPTTVYTLQKARQIVRHDKPIVTRFYCYETDHEGDWNIFVQRPAYSYNKEIDPFSNSFLISFALSRNWPGTERFDCASASLPDITCINIENQQFMQLNYWVSWSKTISKSRYFNSSALLNSVERIWNDCESTILP